MIYEIRGAFNSLRTDSFGVFARKILAYFQHLYYGLGLRRTLQHDFQDVEGAVDYALTAGHGVICPGQVRSEIIRLTSLVRSLQPRVVVEIGTATGGTLFLWCANAAPDATVISIDLPNGIHGGGYPYWKTFLYRGFANKKQAVRLFRGDSHSLEMLTQLKAALAGRHIDFLFIDGDHTYNGVRKDFENYSPLVKPGGVVALHDVARHPAHFRCEVDAFWKELKTKYDYRELIECEEQGWAGIGVVFIK